MAKTMSVNKRDEDSQDKFLCIECKQPIPRGSRICAHCKSYQSTLKNNIRYWGLLIGFLAGLLTAVVHTVALWPKAKTVLFPSVRVDVIEFKSNKRLIAANNGDHEVFISYVHYRAREFPYEDIVTELMAQAKDTPLEDICIDFETKMDMFDTNQEVGIIIHPGQIVEHQIKADIPDGLSCVHGKKQKEWQRIVLIAGLNKKSKCIRPVFFSVNDRRLLQLRRAFGDSLNTFPAIGILGVYSSRLKRSLKLPFEVVGTVWIGTGECERKLKLWVDPRRGHPSDLQ